MKCSQKQAFMILWLGSVIGLIAVLPYLLTTIKTPLSGTQIILTILQGTIMYGIVTLLGIKLSDQVGFKIALLEKDPDFNISKNIFKPGVAAGLFTGAFLLIIDTLLFRQLVPQISLMSLHDGWFYGFLASIYGAINEEVFMRLFLMSFCVWIINKITKQKASPSVVWGTIIFTSLLFGLGHLPATAQIMPLNIVIVVRALLLNGVAGSIFGWLFWKKGLEAAILAHFITDIIIHVLPTFI